MVNDSLARPARRDRPPKLTVADLAIAGAAPAFAVPLHVGAPNLGDRRRLFERLEGMLERRWLTNDGPLVPAFEAEIARRTGAHHCVAVANATLGLDLAARELGMRGEVIVPAFTFVAPVHALAWAGATPVFCDVDPRTHLVDPAQVEALITPRTTGIVAVHLWGQSCDTVRLAAIARRHGVPLLVDGAHAFGAAVCGGFSVEAGATVFSFHATKVVNAFEGGAVVTNDGALAARLRAARTFGFVDVDEVAGVGTNAKMSEASAAMGLTSLESLDAFSAVNRRNYARYDDGLHGVPGIHLRPPDGMAGTTMHYVVVELDAEAAGVTRDQLLDVLHAEGVRARRYFHPGCHRMAPYRDRGPLPSLPVTERLCACVLQLPTGTAVSEGDVQAVCELIRLTVANAAAVVEALRAAGAARPRQP